MIKLLKRLFRKKCRHQFYNRVDYVGANRYVITKTCMFCKKEDGVTIKTLD